MFVELTCFRGLNGRRVSESERVAGETEASFFCRCVRKIGKSDC